MHRLGYASYVAAAAEFFRESQTSGALLAFALLGWAVAAELLVQRTTWSGPSSERSGYGAALSSQNATYLSSMNRFAFAAKFLSIGIGLFGPLLFVWSLLF